MESNLRTSRALAMDASDTCAECHLQAPSCSAVPLTPQCTDQCVVVACNDPAHGQMSCHDAQHCDDIVDCTDCNGFEEFVSLFFKKF